MAIITDATGRQLAQAVGGIDVSGLAKDTTLQAINNTLQNLQIDVSQTASNVSFDNTTSGLTATNVQGAIDEVNDLRYQAKSYNTSIAVNNMHGNNYNGLYWINKTSWSDMPQGFYGYLEVCGNLQKFYPYSGTGLAELYVRMYANNAWNNWNRVQSTATASITRQSGVSSNVPIPDIDRRGNVVIIHFAQQFPAGTYYNLYKVTPTPIKQQHALCSFNSNIYTVTILSDGTIRFNNSITISSSSYIIGQLVYLTDE